VVAIKFTVNNVGAEGTSWVERPAGEQNPYRCQCTGEETRDNHSPASSAMKSASPIPIGARKVALCFSAASMKMQKMSSKVRNASMNKPRTTDVFVDKVVRTARGPGNRAETTAAAQIPARSCVMMSSIALTKGTAPISAKATVTCEQHVSRAFV
jgi:hypothetical protein